jgi:hypothetical protein
MKFLTTLLAFNFLCVWCFGFQDCEGDDFVCEELLPIRPELSTAIAYEDGETMAYSFEDSNTTHGIRAFRNELAAGGSQQCQDVIHAGFSIHGGEETGFSVRLSTDIFNRNVLHFNYVFTLPFGPTTSEDFEVLFEASGEASVAFPLELRIIPDTVLAGNTYRDVLLVEASDASEGGEVTAFYYSTTEGLLRVERVSEPAFLRTD